MQTKRVSSDSPTITALKSRVKGMCDVELLFNAVMVAP